MQQLKHSASSTDIPLGDEGVVSIGDVVLFFPDKTSRDTDEKNGYKLGLCMGRVLQCDPAAKSVQLWWLFGDAWSHKTRWVYWRDRASKARYTDWIPTQSLLVTSFGTLAKVELKKAGHEAFRLTKASVDIIKDVKDTQN